MPKCPASACKGFSSTPVKTRQCADFQVSEGLDDGVLSDDEDTFSLLSPIYHDSFDSDEEDCSIASISELPKTPSERMSSPAVHPAVSPSHSAWEVWLLNKTKEDRLKLEKKVEESLLKEKQEMQQRERELKKTIAEEKILGWLKVKREQVKKDFFNFFEMQRQQEKQRDINQKAQQKYKDWLQKKNQERAEKEKKEKEEASMKEKLERERRRSAEEKFKEWLTQAKEKSRASPALPSYPTSKLILITISTTRSPGSRFMSLLQRRPQTRQVERNLQSRKELSRVPALLLDSETLICCRKDDTNSLDEHRSDAQI
uniref:Coiled-coil domain-containing protein n=1 Tax=Nothobranchius furzeri TaxID=105023 RepID=A0A8C6Q464_NOTFU